LNFKKTKETEKLEIANYKDQFKLFAQISMSPPIFPLCLILSMLLFIKKSETIGHQFGHKRINSPTKKFNDHNEKKITSMSIIVVPSRELDIAGTLPGSRD